MIFCDKHVWRQVWHEHHEWILKVGIVTGFILWVASWGGIAWGAGTLAEWLGASKALTITTAVTTALLYPVLFITVLIYADASDTLKTQAEKKLRDSARPESPEIEWMNRYGPRV